MSAEVLIGAIGDPSAIASKLGVAVRPVHVAGTGEAATQRAGALLAAAHSADVEAAKMVYCCVNCLTDSICGQAWPKGSIPTTAEA